MIILEIVTYFLLGGLTTLILREVHKHYKHRKEVRKISGDAEQQIEDVISNVINTEITYGDHDGYREPNGTAYQTAYQVNGVNNFEEAWNTAVPPQGMGIRHHARPTYPRTWVEWEEKEDFLPKKRMKVHKLDQDKRKNGWTERAPGVYMRETDISFMEWPREQHNDLIG